MFERLFLTGGQGSISSDDPWQCLMTPDSCAWHPTSSLGLSWDEAEKGSNDRNVAAINGLKPKLRMAPIPARLADKIT
jgi:hypothetical protein